MKKVYIVPTDGGTMTKERQRLLDHLAQKAKQNFGGEMDVEILMGLSDLMQLLSTSSDHVAAVCLIGRDAIKITSEMLIQYPKMKWDGLSEAQVAAALPTVPDKPLFLFHRD